MAFRGDVLRAARDRAGLSAGELAALVGASDGAAVRAWERGRVSPAPRRIPVIARAVGVEPLRLVQGDDQIVTLTVLRRAAGLTLKEVADRVRMSFSRYQAIEHGGVLREPEKARISDALGVSIAEIERAWLQGRRGNEAECEAGTVGDM